MDIPGDLFYTSDHEWVRKVVDADGEVTTVRIGITAYASDALGDVVFIEIPAVGAIVESKESMGELESTKSVSDLYAPVAGTVTEVNAALVETPGLVNSDPYGQGWLCEIRVSDARDLDTLLDAAGYQGLTGE